MLGEFQLFEHVFFSEPENARTKDIYNIDICSYSKKIFCAGQGIHSEIHSQFLDTFLNYLSCCVLGFDNIDLLQVTVMCFLREVVF